MIDQLIKSKKKQFETSGFIEFSSDEYAGLSTGDIDKIIFAFRGFGLMKIPASEIEFFEWLKQNDHLVWEDLWAGSDEPYIISVDFMHHFTKDANGFPICDLEKIENYWFSEQHLKPKSTEIFDVIDQKLKNQGKLTIEELLLVEISRYPIDIWHFCYKYKIPLNIARQKIEVLKTQDYLVHLTNREDLVKYIEI